MWRLKSKKSVKRISSFSSGIYLILLWKERSNWWNQISVKLTFHLSIELKLNWQCANFQNGNRIGGTGPFFTLPLLFLSSKVVALDVGFCCFRWKIRLRSVKPLSEISTTKGPMPIKMKFIQTLYIE